MRNFSSTPNKSKLFETTSLIILLHKSPRDRTKNTLRIWLGLLVAMAPQAIKAKRANQPKIFRMKSFVFRKPMLPHMVFIFTPVFVKLSRTRNMTAAKIISAARDDTLPLDMDHLDMAVFANGNCESPKPIKKDYKPQKVKRASFIPKDLFSIPCSSLRLRKRLAMIAATIFEIK